MADKKIVFTSDAVYSTVPPVHFKAGQVETLREDHAYRWLSRGVATDEPAAIEAAEAKNRPAPPAVEPEPAPPVDEPPVEQPAAVMSKRGRSSS